MANSGIYSLVHATSSGSIACIMHSGAVHAVGPMLQIDGSEITWFLLHIAHMFRELHLKRHTAMLVNIASHSVSKLHTDSMQSF